MPKVALFQTALACAVVPLILSSPAVGADVKSVCFNYVATCQAVQRAAANPAPASSVAKDYEECKSWERRANAEGFDDARCGMLLYGQPRNLAVREPPAYRQQGGGSSTSPPGTVWIDARPPASGGAANAFGTKTGPAAGKTPTPRRQGRWACDKETACSGEDQACREQVRRQCGR